MPTATTQTDPVALAAKAAMDLRGISARRLAQKLRMKPRTVLDFLEQRRDTRDSTRFSICRELGIDHEQEATPAPSVRAASAEALAQEVVQ